MTKATVDKHKLTNVEYILALETNPRLPNASIDLVFIAYSYHEFADPEAMMSAVRRSLKPGGRVVDSRICKGEQNRAGLAASQDELRRNPARDRADGLYHRPASRLPSGAARGGVHNKVTPRSGRKSGRSGVLRRHPCRL